jgi:hypothetical protein
MRYTQGQVRDLRDIPVETFRTWREMLPALGRHRGHGPTLTPGDIVSLAVIAEIVRDYGIKIGTVATRLSEILAQTKLVVPCRPIIARLRVTLSEAEPDGTQGHLPCTLSCASRI